MREMKIACNILTGELEEMRLLGRPRSRWKCRKSILYSVRMWTVVVVHREIKL
jgi:hypothetical protein